MISVIIPACNEEKYLEDTIKSIKYQNFNNHEIIVVCDGCTDNTEKIAKKLTDKVVVLKDRKGPAVAKNEGVKLAKHNKLVFLDADTKLTENVLTEISKAIDNNSYGTCKIKPSSNALKHKIMLTFKNYLVSPFGVSNGIIFCSKDLFIKAGGFGDVKKGEDGNLVRKLKKDHRFVILKNPVINSTRRFDQKGYLGVWLYWLKETIKPTDKDYEVIR